MWESMKRECRKEWREWGRGKESGRRGREWLKERVERRTAESKKGRVEGARGRRDHCGERTRHQRFVQDGRMESHCKLRSELV